MSLLTNVVSSSIQSENLTNQYLDARDDFNNTFFKYYTSKVGSSAFVDIVSENIEKEKVQEMARELLSQFEGGVQAETQSIFQSVMNYFMGKPWTKEEGQRFVSEDFKSRVSTLPGYQKAFEDMGVSKYLRPQSEEDAQKIFEAAQYFMTEQRIASQKKMEILLDIKTNQPLVYPPVNLLTTSNYSGPYNVTTAQELLSSPFNRLQNPESKYVGAVPAIEATLDLSIFEHEVALSTLESLEKKNYSLMIEEANNYLEKLDGQCKDIDQKITQLKSTESGSEEERKITEKRIVNYSEEKASLQRIILKIKNTQEEFLANNDGSQLLHEVALKAFRLLKHRTLWEGKQRLMNMMSSYADLNYFRPGHLQNRVSPQLGNGEQEIVELKLTKDEFIQKCAKEYHHFIDPEVNELAKRLFGKQFSSLVLSIPAIPSWKSKTKQLETNAN